MSIKRYRPTLTTDDNGTVRASMTESVVGEYVLYDDVPKKDYEVEVTASIRLDVSDIFSVTAFDEEEAEQIARDMADEHDWDLDSNNDLSVDHLVVDNIEEV